MLRLPVLVTTLHRVFCSNCVGKYQDPLDHLFLHAIMWPLILALSLFQSVKILKNPLTKHVAACTGSLNNEQFDYAENADNESPLSTPSNSYWESPFAQDSLGDTVIHLDKASYN